MKRKGYSAPTAQTGEAPSDGGTASMNWQEKGGRNATTNESKRGAGGIAPKPSGGAALMGNDRPSAPVGASMARVKGVGTGFAGSRMPLQSPKANIASKAIGQQEVDPGGPGISVGAQTRTPRTSNAVATNKPKRKGLGSAFFGEY